MEVYGVKPKKFTKEWWGYFWYYYKMHTLAGLFVSFLIITSLVQCVTQTKYDLQIDFITEYGITSEQESALKAILEENIEDATGNGVNEAFVLSLNMLEGDVQMTQALTTKLMIEFGYTEGYAFIMTKKYADMVSEHGVMEKTSDWAGELGNDSQVISLAGCKALSDIGIDAEAQDLYIGVIKLREENKDKELEIARYENGKRVAQFLINQR